MGKELNAGNAGPAREGDVPAAKATLTRLEGDGGLETLPVRWNPSSYRLRRASRIASEEVLGQARIQLPLMEREELSTELFLDTAGEEGEKRDARRTAEILRRWMDPLPGGFLPPKVLFHWGSFRFAGRIEEVDEEWIRFDPDGTPVRGRIRLAMRH